MSRAVDVFIRPGKEEAVAFIEQQPDEESEHCLH